MEAYKYKSPEIPFAVCVRISSERTPLSPEDFDKIIKIRDKIRNDQPEYRRQGKDHTQNLEGIEMYRRHDGVFFFVNNSPNGSQEEWERACAMLETLIGPGVIIDIVTTWEQEREYIPTRKK